jgi:hypothetical protein
LLKNLATLCEILLLLLLLLVLLFGLWVIADRIEP